MVYISQRFNKELCFSLIVSRKTTVVCVVKRLVKNKSSLLNLRLVTPVIIYTFKIYRVLIWRLERRSTRLHTHTLSHTHTASAYSCQPTWFQCPNSPLSPHHLESPSRRPPRVHIAHPCPPHGTAVCTGVSGLMLPKLILCCFQAFCQKTSISLVYGSCTLTGAYLQLVSGRKPGAIVRTCMDD